MHLLYKLGNLGLDLLEDVGAVGDGRCTTLIDELISNVLPLQAIHVFFYTFWRFFDAVEVDIRREARVSRVLYGICLLSIVR